MRITLGELNNLQRKVYGRDLNGLKSNSGLKRQFGLTDVLFALLEMRLLIQFENTFKSRADYSDSSHRRRFASNNGFSRKISIKSGLYRLRANLYSGTSPLAHLVAKARLNEGSQQIDFKAHWSVLPKQTNDLRLRDFVIERMSPSSGELNSFGESEISEFTIDDFAYDSLQQLPYQANKQEMQSLEFLQGLAAGQ